MIYAFPGLPPRTLNCPVRAEMPEGRPKLQTTLDCQLPASLANAQVSSERRKTGNKTRGSGRLGVSVYKALNMFSVFSFSEASRPILRAEDLILGAFQMPSPWMRTPDLSLSRQNLSLLHLQTSKSRKTHSLVPTRAESLWAQVMPPLRSQGLPKHTVMQETIRQFLVFIAPITIKYWDLAQAFRSLFF